MPTLTPTRREILIALAALGALSTRGIAATTSSNPQRNLNVLYGRDTLTTWAPPMTAARLELNSTIPMNRSDRDGYKDASIMIKPLTAMAFLILVISAPGRQIQSH